MDAKKIDALIAASRRARGLTQQQLAAELGVTNRAVSKWETGQGLPDIALLPALAAALGITVDELLAGETAPLSPTPEEEPMDGADAPEETLSPEETASDMGEALADLPRMQPTRQEWAAAVLSCRKLPSQRLVRRLLALAGTAALLAGTYGAFHNFFTDTTSLQPLVLLTAGLVLWAESLLGLRLSVGLWNNLCRRPACTLYKDVALQEDGTQLPLVELALVRRYRGCTVLVWNRRPLPLALVVPDAACTDSADALQRYLHQLVPAVCRFGTARTPRMHRPVKVAGLAVVGLALFAFALAPALGLAGTISPTGTVLMLRRDPETGIVTDVHSGHTFPYPVVGRMKKQWMTGDCCAVTYQTTDGSTHVYLATYGDRGSGYSYYYVEPLLTGTWRQYEDALSPGVTLRKDSGSADIRILSDFSGSDYSQVYRQTVQFGTLGVALCDEEGLPHWTVVLGRDYDAEEGIDPSGSLIVCPVSMEPTEAVTLHYYSEEEQERAFREAMGLPSVEEEEKLQALETTPPTFSDEQDYTVREDGVYFTWDGGSTYSKAMGGGEGVETAADMNSCTMTDTMAAFLTVSELKNGESVTLHLTHDKGQNWQTIPLADFTDVHPISYMEMHFLDDSFGWFAASTGWSMGTGMMAGFYTTHDGGLTWEDQLLPGKVGNTDGFTGVVFCSENAGAATTHSPNESDWPRLFLTPDGGRSWQEPILPWDDLSDDELSSLIGQGVYAPGRVTGITDLGDDHWEVTLAQGANEQQEIVLAADSFDGPWLLKEVRSVS